MIRLIAIDMDGTLLNQNHQVSERNKQAIINAQQRGVEVVVATGRGFPEAEHPVLQAGLKLPYICLNGGETRDPQGNVLSSVYIQKEIVPEILSIFQEEALETLLFVGDHMFVKDIEDLVDGFIELGKDGGQIPDVEAIRAEVMDRVEEGYVRTTPSFHTLIREHPDQVYKFFGSSTDLNALESATLKLSKLQSITVTSSGSKNIEITSSQAQKGIALEKYCNDHNIPFDQVMVIGDSYNDLSMIQKAKISFAMENAPDDIKAACTYVTGTNKADGVAQAIESILQKQLA